MIVDFHQHLWPDGFRRQLERRTSPPYLRRRRLVLPLGGAFEVDPGAYAPDAVQIAAVRDSIAWFDKYLK